VIQVVVPALAGAGGAVLGARLTRSATLESEAKRQDFEQQREERRERAEREKEERVQSRTLKEAARLTDEELRDATELIRDAVYQGRWWPAPRQFSAAVYTRYRPVLALALDDAAWSAVSFAFQQLNKVNWERSAGVPSLADIGGVGDPMEVLERVDLLSVGLAVIQARQALAPSAAPPDKDSLLGDDADAVAAAVFPVPDDLEDELRPFLEGEEDEDGEADDQPTPDAR